VTGLTWTGTRSDTYEGDDDGVFVEDDGKHLSGESQFIISIDPGNEGILLRRRMKYAVVRQKANVYIDGVPAGTWYDPGNNTSFIWRDSEFMVPPALSRAKSVVTVRVENVSTESDWTEFRYWAYSLRPTTPGDTLPIASDPAPPDGASDLDYTAALAWTAHPDATGHDLYFGTDIFAVAQAGTGSDDFVAFFPLGSETYDPPGLLVPGTTYYWRVDEHHAGGDPARGPLWRFTAWQAPGDFDRDMDVDQEDFGYLQACYTGHGVISEDPACQDASLDDDGDVDPTDFTIFQGCMSGANVPAEPGCAGPLP
jgi:hypothetical protein